ncbi:MAG: hypothetical protein C0179_04090 [Fervidicoccus sp.]|nr:MAG: hypothetical protein C0179_04090 [Fervidicoccus sp.]
MLNRKGGSLARVGMKLTPALLIYVSIVLMRAANASFIVSLVAAFPSISAYMQGIIQASYSLTEAIFGIFAGIIYEYLGSFRSILLSSSLLFASYAAMVVFSSIEVGPQAFAVPSALAGLSASFLLTSSFAVISEETTYARNPFGLRTLRPKYMKKAYMLGLPHMISPNDFLSDLDQPRIRLPAVELRLNEVLHCREQKFSGPA